MKNIEPVFSREGRTVDKITIDIPGPIESWDRDAPWDWPDWPNGPVGAAQTGGGGIKGGRSAALEGLNPLRYSFHTARSLLQQMRDEPPVGKGSPIHPEKYTVRDTGEMSRNIKSMARYLGADLTGIVRLTPDRIKIGVFQNEQEYVSSYSCYIVVAVAFDPFRSRTRLIHPNFSRPVRGPSAQADPIKAYFEIEGICAHLAGYIRGLGYRAESQGTGRRLMNGPFANWGGLGETGRLNLVITPEFGPLIHMGGVLTDLPVTEDKPIDIGVQDFCDSCRRCVNACPAGALTDGPKQLVRGVMKWPVNRKRCVELGRTYGGAVDYGCQQCQVVCAYNIQPEFIDFDDRETGENATLGMWTRLWHERGRADDHIPLQE